MSRKDYRAFAEVLNRQLQSLDDEAERHDQETVASVARGLADVFKRDNSNFRYDRFFEACGLDVWGEVRNNS